MYAIELSYLQGLQAINTTTIIRMLVLEMCIITKTVKASAQRTKREAISFREPLPPNGQVRFCGNHGQQHANDVVLQFLEECQAKRPAAHVRLSQRELNTVNHFAV